MCFKKSILIYWFILLNIMSYINYMSYVSYMSILININILTVIDIKFLFSKLFRKVFANI